MTSNEQASLSQGSLIDNNKKYLEGNVRLTCVACNVLRQGDSTAGGAHHVDRLKKSWRSGSWKLRDGFISSVAPTVAPTSGDLREIDTWAKLQLKRIKSRCEESRNSGKKVKRCLLGLEDLKAMIKASWAGDGHFFDVTGAAFSLEWASIDRLDSDGDYQPGNCRIMHVGLNGLKNACIDDSQVVDWAGDGPFCDITGATFPLSWASFDRLDSHGHYERGNVRLIHIGLNGLKNACKDDRQIAEWLNKITAM